jgi:hypothetical protein
MRTFALQLRMAKTIFDPHQHLPEHQRRHRGPGGDLRFVRPAGAVTWGHFIDAQEANMMISTVQPSVFCRTTMLRIRRAGDAAPAAATNWNVDANGTEATPRPSAKTDAIGGTADVGHPV